MTPEQLDDQLDEVFAKPKEEWTPADLETIWQAYQEADHVTKDEALAILRGSKMPQ